MGRGCRQRIPSRGLDPDVDNHRAGRARSAGLWIELRIGYGDPLANPLQAQ